MPDAPAATVGFFTPTDILALGGSFVIQSDKPTSTLKRAQGLLANGDEGIRKMYGAESKRVLTYEYQSASGTITLPKVGSVISALHIDSIDVEYKPEGWPQITFNCHQHGSNPHTSGNTLNLFLGTIALPAQFGIPRSIQDTTVPTAVDIFKLALGDASIGVKSVKYTLSCTHLDEDISGEHLAGDNRDGVEKLDIGLTGIPGTAPTIGANWDQPDNGTDKGNTKADESSISLEHHIARFAAA